MFWNESPFTINPEQHEEINVIAKLEENIDIFGQNCSWKSVKNFDKCVRKQTENNMYNSTFAEHFCGLDAFGNCTIPQV